MISIVTVCFDAEKVVEKTINSVLNHSYTDYEYVLIDLGSRDSTNDIIIFFKDKFLLKEIPIKAL